MLLYKSQSLSVIVLMLVFSQNSQIQILTPKPRQRVKKQRHHFAGKVLYSQSYGFSSSHIRMWQLDHKEGWSPKNWCFWIVVLDKILESPLDCKEIEPVNHKGNQPWIFIGRTDAEVLILWPPDVKNWLIGKDPDAGKDCRQKKGTKEDEIVAWHHQLNRHEFEQAPGVGDGQRSLVCCSPWGRKESDKTVQLNWAALSWHNCSSISGVTGHPCYRQLSHLTFKTFLSSNFYTHIHMCIPNIPIKYLIGIINWTYPPNNPTRDLKFHLVK